MFWSPTFKRYIFIIGEPGCGKSTFLDYYLRCYCPAVSEPPRDYKKKLIIHLDLRDVSTPTEFVNEFYRQTKERIIRGFEEQNVSIETAHSYYFWKDRLRFDVPESKSLQQKLDMSDAEYRYFLFCQREDLSPESWCKAALQYLTDIKEEFSYVVFVLDNLDQSDLEVQTNALRFLETFQKNNPRINFWRVFLPFWPESLERILQANRPLPDGEQIRLGPVDRITFLERRYEAIEQCIENEQKDEDQLNPNSTELWNVEYFRDFRNHVRIAVSDWIDELCGACVRLKRSIYVEVLCNQALRQRYLKSKQSNSQAFADIGRHAVMTGLLTGRFSHWCEINHPVVNLFLGSPHDLGARSLLLGPHFLSILKKGERSVTQVSGTLVNLGYPAEAVESCIERFEKGELLKVFQTPGGASRFRVYDHTVSAYWKAMQDPAYIEVMMVRCYCDESRLKHMHDTGVVLPEDFCRRVRTAIKFLEQLWSDELRFIDVKLCPVSVDSSTFRLMLRRLELPSVFKLIALSYLGSLRFVRNIVPPLPATKEEWDQFESEEVFRVAQHTEQILRPNG